jgi:hypothetical protein
LPPSPAFISFNNINTPDHSLQKPQNTRHSVTIIQGHFTITEIASLLSQQDQI